MSMKNYVILLAGGVGKRMQTDIPKQFIVVEEDRSLFIQPKDSNVIRRLSVLLLFVYRSGLTIFVLLLKKYSLTKVRWIIEGGSTGHDSIRNGVFFLKDKIDSDDYIIVHDAVRPILPQKAIDEVIQSIMKR